MTALADALAKLRAAETALARARREYPHKGECAVRAVIDVEAQEVRRSIRHVSSAVEMERLRGERGAK